MSDMLVVQGDITKEIVVNRFDNSDPTASTTLTIQVITESEMAEYTYYFDLVCTYEEENVRTHLEELGSLSIDGQEFLLNDDTIVELSIVNETIECNELGTPNNVVEVSLTVSNEDSVASGVFTMLYIFDATAEHWEHMETNYEGCFTIE